MSFKDCIQTAVEAGKLSARKGEQAKEAFDEAGGDALTALEKITNLTAAKRWQRLNEMQVQHKLYTRFQQTERPDRELLDIGNDIDITHQRIVGQAMSGMDNVLLKYKPAKGGLIHPIDNMDNIVHASYGDVRNAESKEMFDAIYEGEEFLRNLANERGANIPNNPNRRLPQTLDRIKVRRVSENEFISDIRDRVDWDLMKYEGKDIPVDRREEILAFNYEGVVSQGKIRLKVGQAEYESLANRLERDRFFYYKSADDWLFMQEKYGAGNVVQQVYGMVDSMSRDISLMEHLGPNPATGTQFVKNLADKRGAELELSLTGKQRNKKKSWEARINEAKRVFDEEISIFRNHVLNGEENVMAQTLGATRTVLATAKLGSAFFSNLNDLMTAKWAFALHQMPETKVIRTYIDHFIANKRSAQDAIRDGVVFQSAMNIGHAYTRYFGPMDGAAWAQRWGDINYRAQLATLHNSTIRHAVAQKLLGHFADNAGKRLDDFPFGADLRKYNITDEDWDAFRKTPLLERDGAKFLRPLDMWRQGDKKAKRVADKFQDYMQQVIRDAVPERSLRTKSFLGQDVPATSVKGQWMRTVGMLQGFPAEIMFNHLRKLRDMPEPRDKFKLAAKFVTYLTLGGAFITQVKALAVGDNPYNMNPFDDPATAGQFWLRAFLNGGSAGILGDFIFNNVNIANGQYFPRGTPVAEAWKAFQELAISDPVQLYQGKDANVGKDAIAAANLVIPKLWWFRLIYERAIGDELLQGADPAAFARKEKFHREIAPQGRWWNPGEEPTLPDLTTAI